MENYPWQLRARRAGLKQRTLAWILGHMESSISSQLRGHWGGGVPRHVKAAILAWEEMTPEQRSSWLAKIEQAAEEDSRRAPKKKLDSENAADFRALQKEVRELRRRLAEAEAKKP
jgi:hypothetical protein